MKREREREVKRDGKRLFIVAVFLWGKANEWPVGDTKKRRSIYSVRDHL